MEKKYVCKETRLTDTDFYAYAYLVTTQYSDIEGIACKDTRERAFHHFKKQGLREFEDVKQKIETHIGDCEQCRERYGSIQAELDREYQCFKALWKKFATFQL